MGRMGGMTKAGAGWGPPGTIAPTQGSPPSGAGTAAPPLIGTTIGRAC